MDEEQVVHALLTPVRRFPAKAVARATEDRDLGVGAARRVLRTMIDEVRGGAQPRPIEGTLFFDAGVSFGAIHACWILGFHRAPEGREELDAVVSLSDAELDALFGDTTHETLPEALDWVADEATLVRWAGQPLAPDAQAAVHDALIRRVVRGEMDRAQVVALVSDALERWVNESGPRRDAGLALCALSHLGLCLASEDGPLRSLLDDDGVGAKGTFTTDDLDALPEDEAALRVRWSGVPTEPTDPRSVEKMGIYAWLPPPKTVPKKKARKKKPKRKKRR